LISEQPSSFAGLTAIWRRRPAGEHEILFDTQEFVASLPARFPD
jgi:hypothetical protein